MQWALWDDLLVLVLLTLCCAVLRPELCAALGTHVILQIIYFGLLVSSHPMWGKEKERKSHLQKSMCRFQDVSRSFPVYGALSTQLPT